MTTKVNIKDAILTDNQMQEILQNPMKEVKQKIDCIWDCNHWIPCQCCWSNGQYIGKIINKNV